MLGAYLALALGDAGRHVAWEPSNCSRMAVCQLSGWRSALVRLLLMLALLVPMVAGALPAIGDTFAGAVEISFGRKVPLPPGSYKVVGLFEDSTPIGGVEIGGAQRREPIHVITLVNSDPLSDFPLIVFDLTVGARVNWGGQPCDTAPTSNVPLSVQKFGTTASSIVVKCQRAFPVTNLRTTVQGAATATSDWVRKRLGPANAHHALMPNNALLLQGFISKGSGDRLNYWYYAHPGHFGLDDAAGRPSLFRSLDGKDERAASARAYLAATTQWGESQMELIEQYFVSGRFGSPTAKGLEVAGLRRVNAPTLSTESTAVAAPSAAAQSPATQAPPAARPAETPLQAVARIPLIEPEPGQKPPQAVPPSPQFAQPAPPPMKVHALVIGNGSYANARLANPRNDANAIADRFRRFGFQVTLLLDASRQQMVKTLAQFSDAARDADVGILFYAGHGMQVGGTNYLVPIDVDLSGNQSVSVPLEAVSLDSLLQEHLPGKTRLVFLDACRDNPLARSLAGQRGSGRGLAPAQSTTGTLISYATRDGGTAADGDATNSPYTTGMLANLDAAEDIALVLRKVRQHVLTSTRGKQEPWEYGSLVGGSLVLSRVAARP